MPLSRPPSLELTILFASLVTRPRDSLRRGRADRRGEGQGGAVQGRGRGRNPHLFVAFSAAFTSGGIRPKHAWQ